MATIVDAAIDEEHVALAYERVKGDRDKIATHEIVKVNTDIDEMVKTILGVLPEVRQLRPRIANLAELDLAAFDKLEDYALAMSYAQTLYLLATQPPDDLERLIEQGKELHERLEADVRALAVRGLVDDEVPKKLKGMKGYANLAQDLQLLSGTIQQAWPKIEGKVLTTEADLQGAFRISTRLTRVVGLREQGPAAVSAATDQRHRSFTLLYNAYEETRRAVAYLRAREGDAETITPSLYSGKTRSKPSEKESGGETAAGSAPSVPVTVPNSTPAVSPSPSTVAEKAGPFMS
jgi:hypothetical protein